MKFFEYSEYHKRCAEAFAIHKAWILSLVPSARIEHIGSSAIPGAVSKGDLDIFVGVSPDEHDRTVSVLINGGFIECSNTLRTHELCMLLSPEPEVSLQVVANGSEFEFFIIFREALRKSPALLSQYNRLKRSCEPLCQEEYRKIKSEFIENVIRSA